MRHVRSQIAALLDGRLDTEAAETVIAHIGECLVCANDLAAAREARIALQLACDVPPPEGLHDRLLALGSLAGGSAPAPVRPPERTDPFAATPPTLPRAVLRSRMAGTVIEQHPASRAARRATRWGVGVGAVAAVGLVGLWSAGGLEPVTPSQRPADSLALLASVSRGSSPSVMPVSATLTSSDGSAVQQDLATIAAQGWPCPSSISQAWHVTRIDLSTPDRLEVDLVGPTATAVITAVRGRLDESAIVGATVKQLGETTVWVLSTEPWHAVWQSGDVVVEVVASQASSDVRDLVSSWPAGTSGPELTTRLGRGWDAVTAVLSAS